MRPQMVVVDLNANVYLCIILRGARNWNNVLFKFWINQIDDLGDLYSFIRATVRVSVAMVPLNELICAADVYTDDNGNIHLYIHIHCRLISKPVAQLCYLLWFNVNIQCDIFLLVFHNISILNLYCYATIWFGILDHTC